VATDAQATDFPEAKQLVKVRNQTTLKKSGQIEEATRYFITSLPPSSAAPERLAQIIRRHWRSESHHWQRDACWAEDKCRLRTPRPACALALIRTTLLSLIRWQGRESLPQVFEDVANDLSLGLFWLKSRNLRA
jgi:predicted transposase YbfD/YdcC